jgi:hypothetical protein
LESKSSRRTSSRRWKQWIRGAVANAEPALARLTFAPLPPKGKLSFSTGDGAAGEGFTVCKVACLAWRCIRCQLCRFQNKAIDFSRLFADQHRWTCPTMQANKIKWERARYILHIGTVDIN